MNMKRGDTMRLRTGNVLHIFDRLQSSRFGGDLDARTLCGNTEWSELVLTAEENLQDDAGKQLPMCKRCQKSAEVKP